MSNIIGALTCLKRVFSVSQPVKSTGKNTENPIQPQLVQSVKPIRLSDYNFNKVVQLFVKPACDDEFDESIFMKGTYFSRNLAGNPICFLVQTTAESWVATVARSVKVEWPELDRKPVWGSVLKDLKPSKRSDSTEPRILRESECPDFLMFPVNKGILDFRNGQRIQIRKWELIRKNSAKYFFFPLNGNYHRCRITDSGLRWIHLTGSENNNYYQDRVREVFTSDILSDLWKVYTAVEKDPKLYDKYLKDEIHGLPIDYDRFTEYWADAMAFHKDGDISMASQHGVLPGILPFGGNNGQEYQKITRHEILPPPDGERLPYKSKVSLLQQQRE